MKFTSACLVPISAVFLILPSQSSTRVKIPNGGNLAENSGSKSQPNLASTRKTLTKHSTKLGEVKTTSHPRKQKDPKETPLEDHFPGHGSKTLGDYFPILGPKTLGDYFPSLGPKTLGDYVPSLGPKTFGDDIKNPGIMRKEPKETTFEDYVPGIRNRLESWKKDQ